MFAPSLKVAFPYLYNFSLSLSYFKFSFAANQPTRNDERVKKLSLGFVLLAVPRKDDTVYSIYRKKEKAEKRDIQILVRDLSLSLIRNSLLKLSLSLFLAFEKKE